MNEFYVYLYLREDGTPYYVGKGKGDRAFSNRSRKFKKPKDETKIIFHSENLTEEEAFVIEKELIAHYGRKDKGTGILRNLTDGGEGSSGFIFTDEIKIKISEATKKAMNKPGMKAKISEATKKAMSSPELRSKLSVKIKEAMNKPGMKAKLSEASKKSLSRPEVRAKLSEAAKKRMADPAIRAKLKATTKEAMNRPEVRAKLKAALDNPEIRAKHKAATKAAMNRPEVRASISATLKEYYRKKREAEQFSGNTLTKFFS